MHIKIKLLTSQGFCFKINFMSKVCDICGKEKMRGNTVSHSNRKAPRHYSPNLQRETLIVDGTPVNLKICTKCKKTLAKKG